MYLTRLTLDPRSSQARRDLSNPYDMHRSLVRAFVSDDLQKPPRFLWRAELQTNWSALPVILVQSEQLGNWSHLQALPNYLKKEESKNWHTNNLAPQQRFRFRLFANPTVTRAGKRYGLPKEDEQLAWLRRQGDRHGFNIRQGEAVVLASDVLRGRKDSTTMSLQRACFEGVLTVTEEQLLVNVVRAGIGPGKAFGLGLLSLARFS